MNIRGFGLILGQQVKQKLGRIILASGGIAVGIWAITLTFGLSSGLQSTIITAINSQPFAKELQFAKTDKVQEIDLFSTTSPDFFPQSQAEIQKVIDKYPELEYVVDEAVVRINIVADSGKLGTCSLRPGQKPDFTFPPIDLSTDSSTLEKKPECLELSVQRNNPVKLFENNRSSWVGAAPSALSPKGAVVCFSCFNSNLYSLFPGVKEPKDLIGKTFTFEYLQAPQLYPVNKTVQFSRQDFGEIETSETEIATSVTKTYTIESVIDDRESGAFSFTSNGSALFYVPEPVVETSFALANPGKQLDDYGSVLFSAATRSFQDLEKLVESMKQDKFFVISLGLEAVNGIKTAFFGLNIVLSLFGVIALVASIFGIISIMTISVLERQKEIGILKALGSSDRSIFMLFLTESAVLGVVGWFFGTLFAVSMGYGISAVARALIEGNQEWKQNLSGFNISGFNPEFSLMLLFSTLCVAIFVTCLSGFFPSRRASLQNPADVMRNE